MKIVLINTRGLRGDKNHSEALSAVQEIFVFISLACFTRKKMYGLNFTLNVEIKLK